MSISPSSLSLVASLRSPRPSDADASAGETKAEACVACHGPAGNSTNGLPDPGRARRFRYLYLQLRDFKEGRRKDPVMSPMAGPVAGGHAGPGRLFRRPEAEAERLQGGWPARRPGSKKADETLCTMCHLGGFNGQNEIPRVAGQQPDYVIKQLKDFKARTRTNDAGNMTSVAQTTRTRISRPRALHRQPVAATLAATVVPPASSDGPGGPAPRGRHACCAAALRHGDGDPARRANQMGVAAFRNTHIRAALR